MQSRSTLSAILGKLVNKLLTMKQIFFFTILFCMLISCKQNRKQQTDSGGFSGKGIIHCKPQTTDKDWYSAGTKAPKLEGLKGINFSITTKNKEARDYFNQGLMLSYGFNHAEAARSFYEAIQIDPSCAMCHWGYAYVLGPNYNGGMEEDNFEKAYNAAQKAMTLADNSTKLEKELIQALSYRYTKVPTKDRSNLDIAYSQAMKKVYDKYPANPDVGALYAESLMDLHPWDLYEKNKEPKSWTPEIIATLEHLIRANPKHPGAHHFYIHAVEASAYPEKGLKSAEILETLVPGAGHLVHMPSHIYINTGDYHLGSLANIKAVKADSTYITSCHAQGVYPLSYYPHNYHFLAATATLEGNSQLAWMAAKKVQVNTAKDIMRQPEWGTLQHYYTIPYYVAVKFGMWDTILEQPMPDLDLIYPQAVLHYARGMAFLGKNNLSAAKKELDKLNDIAKDTSLKSLTVWDINTSYDLLQIASNLLSAEIASHKKQYQQAISMMNKAIAIEDQLNYNEPPDWFFSVRHHLGAVYIKAGMFSEAEKVYWDDLQTWRKNGWALIGLYNALKKNAKEATNIKEEFDRAWQYADKIITSSSPL